MAKEITLAHGNGGRLMHELVEKLRLQFSNKILDELADAAEVSVPHTRLALSTDSYVVKPLFFPGGDIGKLAICGTVNDISMKGAQPLFIALALIIEEGLEFSVLERVIQSVRLAARTAKVKVVTGDIKVVERGAVDKLFITTSGIGVITAGRKGIGVRARRKDAIVINGSIAEHGMAIFNARENFGFVSGIKSDCCCLNAVVQRCCAASKHISALRDLTRGGLAQALNEIALSSHAGIEIFEKDIPMKPSVQKLCDVVGFDPLYVANEGKFICFVSECDAGKIRHAMGRRARIIGTVTAGHPHEVHLVTKLGAHRIVPMLEADQLPRIC